MPQIPILESDNRDPDTTWLWSILREQARMLERRLQFLKDQFDAEFSKASNEDAGELPEQPTKQDLKSLLREISEGPMRVAEIERDTGSTTIHLESGPHPFLLAMTITIPTECESKLNLELDEF